MGPASELYCVANCHALRLRFQQPLPDLPQPVGVVGGLGPVQGHEHERTVPRRQGERRRIRAWPRGRLRSLIPARPRLTCCSSYLQSTPPPAAFLKAILFASFAEGSVEQSSNATIS